MGLRLFFAAGPGNVIEAHKNWRSGTHDPGQMSITFSSEFESFCQSVGATAYIVSSSSPFDIYTDNKFTIEHRPKRQNVHGIKYHILELVYGLGLVKTAVRFKSDYAVLQSGSMHYFVMSLFRLFGIRVIPIMHNTLWPAGYPPTSTISRSLLFLDSLFFRWVATATLAVSPECARQVEQITRGKHGPICKFTIQFVQQSFEPKTQPPPFDKQPFRLLYSGRIIRNKGVFDLLDIMQRVDAKASGRTRLDICGTGPDLESLKIECARRGLENIVSIRGWTSPADLRSLLVVSHASIVPTRSDFAEGMAMTAIEAILSGRPVITSPVVPALEVLQPACLAARTNDVKSYVNAVIELIEKPALYENLSKSCELLQAEFYDRSQSSGAVLMRAIASDRCFQVSGAKSQNSK